MTLKNVWDGLHRGRISHEIDAPVTLADYRALVKELQEVEETLISWQGSLKALPNLSSDIAVAQCRLETLMARCAAVEVPDDVLQIAKQLETKLEDLAAITDRQKGSIGILGTQISAVNGKLDTWHKQVETQMAEVVTSDRQGREVIKSALLDQITALQIRTAALERLLYSE